MSVQNLPWRDVELKFLWKICLVAVSSADYVLTGFFGNFKWSFIVTDMKLRKSGFYSQLWLNSCCDYSQVTKVVKDVSFSNHSSDNWRGSCPQSAWLAHCHFHRSADCAIFCTYSVVNFNKTVAPVNSHGRRCDLENRFLAFNQLSLLQHRYSPLDRSPSAVRLALYGGLYYS